MSLVCIKISAGTTFVPEKKFALLGWIPDWSLRPETTTETILNPILLQHGLSKTCGDTEAESTIANDDAELVVRGDIIDRVAIIEVRNRSRSEGPKRFIHKFLLGHMDYLTTLPL